MPTPISQLPEIQQADVTALDVLAITDVDDQTQAPTGTTKKITWASLFTNPVIRTALRFFDAVSKLIPGATSFSIRNNGDTQDNLLVTDAGDVTIRQDGIIGRNLKFLSAVAKLIPGATSWSIRNSADTQDVIAYRSSDGQVRIQGDTVVFSQYNDQTNIVLLGRIDMKGDGFEIRNEAGTTEQFRVTTLGAVVAKNGTGWFVGTDARLGGNPNFGHLVLTAMGAPPSNPGDGQIYWDGTDLYVYDGVTRYRLNKTAAP